MQSYTAVKSIGEGSFGEVFLVQGDGGKLFALKKIHVGPFETEQALLEIELMKKFTHPNLVKVYDYHLDEEEEELQIIMEYCEEGDLMHYSTLRKTLPAEQVLAIFRQILKAFLVMSVRGVIHRDLKPENILLGKGHVVKIGDFGCARLIGDMDMSKVDAFSLDKGTFLYASPEQLRNEKYSFRCDVWAAGCIAYLLYFGHHPFMDSKPQHTLIHIRQRTEGKAIELDPSTDPTVAKLISLCLVFQDGERASWREIWLSRVFTPKVSDVRRFVDYLRNVSSIANWITKQFWKVRKEFTISKNSDEIFIYFIIKFQYSVLKMALKIIKKAPNYRYLFTPTAFADYQPSEEQFNQVKKSYLEYEKYFGTIRKAMEQKDSFAEIASRETKKGGCFSDLQKSIRACYKILTDVRPALDSHPHKGNRVWVALSYWINFESWFSYEKDPHLEKFLNEPQHHNITALLAGELQKYQSGSVE